MRNSLIEIDAAGDVLTQQEQRNNRENKPTQYLTRFGNLPTSLGKGERDFIDSTINTSEYQRDTSRDTIHESFSPYL